MKTPYIEILDKRKWKNWHRTRKVGGKVIKLLKPFNRFEDGDIDLEKPFVAGMEGLKSIIRKAVDDDVKVRAYGSRWSLNNIAYTKDFIVDSNALDYCLIGLKKNHVAPAYQHINNQLAFVQCGLMVKELNKKLLEKGLALPTSGASDGQTFIGAVSTGTHGSAHAVGAMENYVRGIHLVTLSDELVFVQRKSDPVITNEFSDWLGNTKLVQDDELFNAALVGFGSFGFVHGLLIETEPLYMLERYITQSEFNKDVRNAICTLNMEGLGLPKGNELPFHFEVVLNPYFLDEGQKGVFIRVLYKTKVVDVETSQIHSNFNGRNDVMGIMTGLSIEHFNKGALAFALQLALKVELPVTEGEMEPKFPGEQFGSSEPATPTSPAPLPGTSLEISVPLNRVGDALDLILEVTNEHPFGAPLAFRYVKNSRATLAFTQYGPITVTMEMPGLDDILGFANSGHNAIFKALETSDIPHAYHWGQAFPENLNWLSESYDSDKIESWKKCRLDLLGKKGVRMFTNKLLEDAGIL